MSLKALIKSFVFLYRFLIRRLKISRKGSFATHATHARPSSSGFSPETLVFDVEGGLLRSTSIFPYFMVVALEAGGFMRGLVLLLMYPLLFLVSHDVGLRVMVMVCFAGLREKGFRAGRAVLPKFLLEDVGVEGVEVVRKGKRRVGVSCMPRVMVEGFLKEYLEVMVVVGRELKVVKGFYTGLMEEDDGLVKVLGSGGGGGDVVGLASYSMALRYGFLSHCKEVYLVSQAEKRNWHPLPREQYPTPLVFHDGRLAFRPTAIATVAMFLYLPLGISLSCFRGLLYILLPYNIALPIGALTGMKSRVIPSSTLDESHNPSAKSRLYVCNHRTLLDPIYISAALNRQVPAVTYSLSRITEMLSPIKTVRLTRKKEEDRRRMENLLSSGDLVVCPEGTTCREAYLLRFSPLFAELTEEVVPVALVTRVAMFHGTTASGLKCFDPIFFLMNPCPEYDLNFLERIPTDWAGNRNYNSREVANYVQTAIGEALGFTCTTLTRRDKYLILADNEGIVNKGKMQ